MMFEKITDWKQLKNSYEKIWHSIDLKEEKKYYESILSLLNVTENKKLLDIACGGGHLLHEAEKKRLKCYGLDISENAIRRTKNFVVESQLVMASAETIPFPKNSFDYVTCLGSLEHFLNPEIGLEEMRRVLKDGGLICIVLPNIWYIPDVIRGWVCGEGLTHGQESERFYSLKQATELIEEHGLLKVKKIGKYNQPPELIKEAKPLPRFNNIYTAIYRLIRNKIPVSASYVFIFICTKRYLGAPSIIEIGNKDHKNYLSKGWYETENWPPLIRWTGKKSNLYININRNSKKLFIRAITHLSPIDGQILIDKKRVQSFNIKDNEWNVIEALIPDFIKPGINEVTIELNKTWIPAEFMKNGDIRELGIAVNKIWVE